MPRVRYIATKTTWEKLEKVPFEGLTERIKEIIAHHLQVQESEVEVVFDDVLRIINGADFQMEVAFSASGDKSGINPSGETLKILCTELRRLLAVNLSGRGNIRAVSVWIIPCFRAVWQCQILDNPTIR